MRSIKRCAALFAVWFGVAGSWCGLCAQSSTPYPPSPVIEGVKWDFHGLIRLANTRTGRSDLALHVGSRRECLYRLGRGGGFDGPSDSIGRVSVGFARIIDLPPHITGKNVWGDYPKYAEHPATFCGKPYSMLSVGGVLYRGLELVFGWRRRQLRPLSPPARRLRNTAWRGRTISEPHGRLSHWKLTQVPGHLTYKWEAF